MNKEQIGKIYTDCALDYYWKAYKKDGSILSQFEEVDGELKEILYTEIDRSPENFKKFELINVNNSSLVFSVDLETGDFFFNGVIIKNNIDTKGSQLQCIFWRKKSITLNTSGQSVSYSHYTLGWQTNIGETQHKLGTNLKKEYKIFPDGSIQEILQKPNRNLFAQANIVKD